MASKSRMKPTWDAVGVVLQGMHGVLIDAHDLTVRAFQCRGRKQAAPMICRRSSETPIKALQ